MKRYWLPLLIAVPLLAACQREPAATEENLATEAKGSAGHDAAPDGLTPYEPEDGADATLVEPDDSARQAPADTKPAVIQILSEFENYRRGKLAVPAFPGDLIYLVANLQNEAGEPIPNAELSIRSRNGTAAVTMADRTDAQGDLEFRLIAGKVGEDLVTVTAAGVQRDFFIDVTQPTRGEWLGGLDTRGTTPWNLLEQATIGIGRQRITAQFPPAVQALGGKRIQLAGFMMPLGVEEKQPHFLLSANPPSCFFHAPGGPASVIEVFAETAVRMSFEGMVVEGTLELVPDSDAGMIYRLRGARLVRGGG